jgi:hypothetical protein
MARVLLKARVTEVNAAHAHVSLFSRLDGEGDRPDSEWALCGHLVFDAADWRDDLSIRFEAMGCEVEP